MNQAEQTINCFLVGVFNDILRLEENSLSKGPCKDLSVTEIHVLEAVQNGGEDPSMSSLAARLRVTASSLTVAVKTLEQKGYLERRRSQQDKRRVAVYLTEKALPALEHHAEFHEKLVNGVSSQLNERQLEELTHALVRLHEFFSGL